MNIPDLFELQLPISDDGAALNVKMENIGILNESLFQ